MTASVFATAVIHNFCCDPDSPHLVSQLWNVNISFQNSLPCVLWGRSTPKLQVPRKKSRGGKGNTFSISLHFIPSTRFGPTQHVALTYLDGLDTFLVRGFPSAGDLRATHFSHIPLEFGAFCWLCFWNGAPPNTSPRGGHTQSWERETKESGLKHCPWETQPHPLTGFSRLLHLSAPPLSSPLSA